MKDAITKAIEGGYEPYRYHFIDFENDKGQPAPKPYLIEIGEEGHQDFECPHKIVVMNWDEETQESEGVNWENSQLGFSYHQILLDPLFWQCLGKALGWGGERVLIDEKGHPKEWMFDEHCDKCGEIIVDQEEGCPDRCESDNAPIPSWLYHWHRFIDHLAEGKNAEEFFSNLLANYKRDDNKLKN
jgi:hypothetical protein